jgi:Cof subfamily protein (haloacid dehalogenase superfamily)
MAKSDIFWRIRDISKIFGRSFRICEVSPVWSTDKSNTTHVHIMMEQATNWPKIKLVATDMDGTLLNSRYELSNDFYSVFEQMKEKGILFAAASGRQFFNLLNRFEAIKEEVIFIAENGSYVVYKGEELLVQAMPEDLTKEQLLIARNIPDTYIVLCGKKKAYIENSNPHFVSKVKLYYDRFELVDDLVKIEDDQFLKIAICDLAGAETNSYTHFGKERDHLQVKVSGSIWLDISHKLADKGRAMAVVQKKYGITKDETMAFGDYLNDLEMMQQAYFSFAMENAHPAIKQAARFMAKSNDENGVLEVLQQMLSNKKS